MFGSKDAMLRKAIIIGIACGCLAISSCTNAVAQSRAKDPRYMTSVGRKRSASRFQWQVLKNTLIASTKDGTDNATKTSTAPCERTLVFSHKAERGGKQPPAQKDNHVSSIPSPTPTAVTPAPTLMKQNSLQPSTRLETNSNSPTDISGSDYYTPGQPSSSPSAQSPALTDEPTVAPSSKLTESVSPSEESSRPPTESLSPPFDTPSSSPTTLENPVHMGEAQTRQPTTTPSALVNEVGLSSRPFNVTPSLLLHGILTRMQDEDLDLFQQAMFRFIVNRIPSFPNALIQLQSVAVGEQSILQSSASTVHSSTQENFVTMLTVRLLVVGRVYASDPYTLSDLSLSNHIQALLDENYQDLLDELKQASDSFDVLRNPSERPKDIDSVPPTGNGKAPVKLIASIVAAVSFLAAFFTIVFCWSRRKSSRADHFMEYESDSSDTPSTVDSDHMKGYPANHLRSPSVDSSSVGDWSCSVASLRTRSNTAILQKTYSLDSADVVDLCFVDGRTVGQV